MSSSLLDSYPKPIHQAEEINLYSLGNLKLVDYVSMPDFQTPGPIVDETLKPPKKPESSEFIEQCSPNVAFQIKALIFRDMQVLRDKYDDRWVLYGMNGFIMAGLNKTTAELFLIDCKEDVVVWHVTREEDLKLNKIT